MFKTRLISGIVLVIIMSFLLITGGYWLLGALYIVSLIGMYELYRVIGLEKSLPACVGYLTATGLYVLLLTGKMEYFYVIVLVAIMILMAVYVFTYPKYRTEQIMHCYFGVFYVALMLSYIYQTRMLEGGIYLVWMIFICSWVCDTCAYCVGMLFGKHKMSPKLSPKKSVEGAVGGVAGAMILGALYGAVFGKHLTIFKQPVISLLVIACVGALISMVGDLAASAIKRNYNVKDYGTLIPGHGGILDRFDSVIFTAPIIYILSVLL